MAAPAPRLRLGGMAALDRSPAPTVDADRVLATVADLAGMGNLDLDAVDGEFWWRFCLPGLAGELEAAWRLATSVTPGSPHDEIRRVSIELAATAQRLYRAHGLPPNVLVGYANGDALRMRGVTVFGPPGGDAAYLPPDEIPSYDHVVVRSAAALSGAEIEARVRSWLDAAPPRFHPEERPPSDWDPYADAVKAVFPRPSYPERVPAAVVHLQLALRLSRQWDEGDHAPTVAMNLSDGVFHVNSTHLDPPFVEVVVGLPLPTPGVIAATYDAVVLRDRRWHERLVLPEQGQEPWTAIRTWGTALVAKSGVTVNDALREVERAMYPGMPDASLVSQTRYQQDKAVLTQRVPEAGPVLRLKGLGKDPGNRTGSGDRSRAGRR